MSWCKISSIHWILVAHPHQLCNSRPEDRAVSYYGKSPLLTGKSTIMAIFKQPCEISGGSGFFGLIDLFNSLESIMILRVKKGKPSILTHTEVLVASLANINPIKDIINVWVVVSTYFETKMICGIILSEGLPFVLVGQTHSWCDFS